jgi:crotonyl-CoA reductase
MMKAWTINRASLNTGNVQLPSESLVLRNVPIPKIVNSNEVLIKLKSSSLNFNTVWSCMRQPMDPFALLAGHIKRNPNDSHHNIDYYIPGSDGAGVVVDVGDGVVDFKPGDQVVIHCAVISDDDLHIQDSMLSKSQSIWGYETNYGAFAEYTLIKSSQLIKKPESLDFLTAGSCLLTLGTAYRMLISENGAQLKKGETCLIWGASGGLGVFAIQLCLAIGATPICIVSDDDKAKYCKEIGANKIIICDRKEQQDLVDINGRPNYLKWRKFEKKLTECLGDSRVDCVFEHIGRNVFSMSIFLLRRGGRLVTCAATTGYESIIDIRYVWMEMKRIIGSHFCTSSEASEALEMVVQKKIKHKYDKAILFDEIPNGLDSLYLRNSRGKIVIQF